MEVTVKTIIRAVRSCRLFRPMTFEEAKALCLELSESMIREHRRTMKGSRPFRLRLYAVKTRLAKASLLLHIRFLVGSKKERTDIILGCFDAHVERMLNPRQRDPPVD
jgi:hypothetical protein